MNVDQFCDDYEQLAAALPRALESLSSETHETAGYSLEEVLLWRCEAMLQATAAQARRIWAADRAVLTFRGSIRERLGVDVGAFLTQH